MASDRNSERRRELMKRLPFRVKRYNAASAPHLKWVVVGAVNGRRVKKFFRSEREAETYARLRNTESVEYGTAAPISFELRVMAQRCQERLASFRKTIEDATQHFVGWLEQNARSRTVEQVFDEMYAEKEQSGFTRSYLNSLRSARKHLVRCFPNKLVSEITVADVNEFLQRFSHQAAETQNYYRQFTVMLFTHGMQRGYCAQNPAAMSVLRKTVEKPVEILTPAELAKLLAAACPRICAAVAIGALAGLRVAELCRLDWRQIRLRAEADENGCFGYIEVTAKNAKSRKRRLVKILPALAAWLKPFARECGAVTCSDAARFDVLRSQAWERAALGRAWPKNALRHSYASYHLAKFADASALALEMGHANTDMMFRHYRELVTREDAEQYWKIAPNSGPHTADVFAFTPEAYSWHHKVFSVADGDWITGPENLAHFFGVERSAVYYWFNENPHAPERTADDRFHIPTWCDFVEKHTRPSTNAKCEQAERFCVERHPDVSAAGEKTKWYFRTESEARSFAAAMNAKKLREEINVEEIRNVIDFPTSARRDTSPPSAAA